jgi:N-acetylglucosaminyldiphosphoundecaprenol N-acetyl-beta-D-mannosaminyltransferase
VTSQRHGDAPIGSSFRAEPPEHPFHTALVAGIPFAGTTMQVAVAWLAQEASGHHGRGVAVRFANAWCAVVANQSPDYASLLTTRGVNFPDGLPVARILARSVSGASQIRGPSFFLETLDAGRSYGLRHFFLGATDSTLAALTTQVRVRFPGVEVAGTFSPPFGPFDADVLAEGVSRIRESRADIVWVGLGSPKQDHAAQSLANVTGLPCCGVGAAFDFTAGTVREAPEWMRRSGIEWLFRLASEPKRLWRRYLLGNAQFLWYAARGHFRAGTS